MSDVRNLHDRGSEPGKMFLGGLSWNTTDDTLKKYFSRYGRLTDCVVIRDGHGRPRGFGFVTFADPSNCEKVLADSPHFIDDRQIDPKLAIPREDCEEPPVQSIETFRTKKLFIGGVPLDADEKKLRKCFEPYGVIKEAFLMYNRDTGEPRGFGFISFDSEETVEYLLAKSELTFEIDGRRLEIKKALPKQSELLARRSELDYYSPHGPVLRQKSEDIDRGRGYRHWDPRERDKDRGRERSREARKERADEKKRGGGIGRERRRGYEPVHDYERDYGRERGSRRSRSLDRYIPSRGREKSYEVDDHYRSAHYSTHGENYIRRGLSPDNVHRAGHTGRSRRDIRDYASSDPYGYYNGDTERVSREFGREQIVANEYSFRDSKEYSTVTGYPAYKNFDSYKESDTSRATDPSPFSKNIRPGELLPYHNSMQGASDNKNEYSSINNYDRSQFLDVPPAKSAYDNYYDQSTSKSHSSLQPYSSYGTSIGAGNPPSRQAQQLPVQRHPPPTALYPPTTSYPRPSASGYQVPGGSSHYRTSALDMSKMTYRPYKPY